MQYDTRLVALPFALALTMACGSPGQQAQPGSAATETPAAGTPGAPAATIGAAPRGEAPADAPAKEPIITTMPMDVPSG
ncbi:MAG TPA: hypothetical protein VGC23_02065, partial [Vicinamibacterales bacterium]